MLNFEDMVTKVAPFELGPTSGIQAPTDASNVSQKQEDIVLDVAEPSGNFSNARVAWFGGVEWEFKADLTLGRPTVTKPVRDEEVANLESEIPGIDAGGARVSEDSLETHTELADAVQVVACSAVANVGDRL